MGIETCNSALLSYDVLHDAGRLLEGPRVVTPAEFHALNSLVEAAVFHEKLYVFDLPESPTKAFEELHRQGVIQPGEAATRCEAHLAANGLDDLAGGVLIDRYWDARRLNYVPDTLEADLGVMLEYEEKLGFARMSGLLDQGGLPEQLAIKAANLAMFSEDDARVVDGSYRGMRAFGSVALELGLHPYTGLISRPFIIGFMAEKRRGAHRLFEQLQQMFDDWDDTDLPEWRRIRVPALTQIVLSRSADKPGAIPQEIIELRDELRDFRATLTVQAVELSRAATRGEKRRIRLETEAALAAATTRMETTERLAHTLWDIAKNPLSAHEKIGDRLVEKDKRDQAVAKVHGLTDLYALLRDAPAIERNAGFIRSLFGIECDLGAWHRIQNAASRMEALMRRREEPPLPR